MVAYDLSVEEEQKVVECFKERDACFDQVNTVSEPAPAPLSKILIFTLLGLLGGMVLEHQL
jgi:hypothetical protein